MCALFVLRGDGSQQDAPDTAPCFAGPGSPPAVVTVWEVIHLREQCGGEPDRSGCYRNNPFRGALHHKHPRQRTRSLLGRAQR